jgi:hypothetical protein
MSFIFSPSASTPSNLLKATQYEAIAALAGVSIGDSLSKRDILDSTGAIISTNWFNETTGLPLATAPTAAQVVEATDSTQDSVDALRTSIERNPENRLAPAPAIQSTANNVVGVINTVTTGQISSLYASNQTAVAGHYIGIVSGSAAPVSGTTALMASFWFSGAANSQLLIDNNYFRSFPSSTGYSVVRSQSPLVFTQLASALASSQLIRTTTLG